MQKRWTTINTHKLSTILRFYWNSIVENIRQTVCQLLISERTSFGLNGNLLEIWFVHKQQIRFKQWENSEMKCFYDRVSHSKDMLYICAFDVPAEWIWKFQKPQTPTNLVQEMLKQAIAWPTTNFYHCFHKSSVSVRIFTGKRAKFIENFSTDILWPKNNLLSGWNVPNDFCVYKNRSRSSLNLVNDLKFVACITLSSENSSVLVLNLPKSVEKLPKKCDEV